jgi:hypothetical protein
MSQTEETSTPSAPYRHIVAFKFKPEATDEQIQALVQNFRQLAQQQLANAVVAFEHGRNVSTEGFDQGFTHVFQLTFRSQAEFVKDYLNHPAHQAFVERLLPILEQPFVVDYAVAESSLS